MCLINTIGIIFFTQQKYILRKAQNISHCAVNISVVAFFSRNDLFTEFHSVTISVGRMYFKNGQQALTPLQYEAIVYYLGEPGLGERCGELNKIK